MSQKTTVDMNFQSLAASCENIYNKTGGTAQGFIRFAIEHLHFHDRVTSFAGMSLSQALRRIVLNHPNLRDNDKREKIIIDAAQAFADDLQRLGVRAQEKANAMHKETAKGTGTRRQDSGVGSTYDEKLLLQHMMESGMDSHAFISYILEKELGTTVHMSRSVICHELLKKYESLERVKDVIARLYASFVIV